MRPAVLSCATHPRGEELEKDRPPLGLLVEVVRRQPEHFAAGDGRDPAERCDKEEEEAKKLGHGARGGPKRTVALPFWLCFCE